MKLEELNELWKKDSIFDEDNLDKESLKTPNLHSRYMEILCGLKLKCSIIESKQKILRQQRFRYYRGELSREELVDLNWTPYQGVKPLKVEIDELLNGDKLIIESQQKLEYYKIMIEYCDSIIRQIKQRDFQIKNSIDWKKFISGY